MIIFDKLVEKNEQLIKRLENEASLLFKNLYFHDIEENYNSILEQRLFSSKEIQSICKDFNVGITISQSINFDKKRTSNTAFINLKSKSKFGSLVYSFYLKMNPLNINENILNFSSFSMKRTGINVSINKNEMTIEMNSGNFFYFVMCNDPYDNNKLGFGLRGYDLKDYKKAVSRYKKSYKDIYPEQNDFYLTLDFLNKLYESNVFEANPELTCDILINSFENKKHDKESLEILKLTHDLNLKFLAKPCPLLNFIDDKKTNLTVKNNKI